MLEKIKSLLVKDSEKNINVVMIIMDALRVDFLKKNEYFKNVLNRGTFFKEMIAYSPYTIASMHSIFTGLYGSKHGVDAYYKNMRFDEDNCLTLPEYLKINGYYTIGDFFRDNIIPQKGWDEILVHDEYKDDLVIRHKELLTRVNNMKNNFFLCLHNSYIHSKVVSEIIEKFDDFDEEYFSNPNRNIERYTNYVNTSANYLSNIFSHIDVLGIADNTLIYLIADHGCSLGEKMGEKAYGIYTYDYSIKVFGIFIYPKIFPPGKEIELQVRTVDIVPTIVDIVGKKPPQKYHPFSGKSLLPIVNGTEIKDRTAIIETGGIDGPFPSPYDPNILTIRKNKWKLIYNTTTKETELYNITDDPKEENNLSDTGLEIQQELWNELNEYKEVKGILK